MTAQSFTTANFDPEVGTTEEFTVTGVLIGNIKLSGSASSVGPAELLQIMPESTTVAIERYELKVLPNSGGGGSITATASWNILATLS